MSLNSRPGRHGWGVIIPYETGAKDMVLLLASLLGGDAKLLGTALYVVGITLLSLCILLIWTVRALVQSATKQQQYANETIRQIVTAPVQRLDTQQKEPDDRYPIDGGMAPTAGKASALAWAESIQPKVKDVAVMAQKLGLPVDELQQLVLTQMGRQGGMLLDSLAQTIFGRLDEAEPEVREVDRPTQRGVQGAKNAGA